MESLFSRALEVDSISCRLPSGRVVALRHLRVRMGNASPRNLRPGTLAETYTSKPLVTFNGAAMFGELAVVHWLEADGWDAAWLDTFHGRRVWRDMPTTGEPVTLPPPQRLLYDEIVAANGGKASGTFDVMGWREGQTIFVEYKGPGDRPNRNQGRWIEAALSVGVSPNDFFIVSVSSA